MDRCWPYIQTYSITLRDAINQVDNWWCAKPRLTKPDETPLTQCSFICPLPDSFHQPCNLPIVQGHAATEMSIIFDLQLN